ncbi:LuxR family transcriptional regulator [Streptomyces sp. TRM64462]|uniref:helix-turn-helix transcriptional regulator n=1 Tax=Streptomyces sp. TRM64462 TaxID=2741726 RepID=UPI001585DDB6|nr:LuxR family transcriptional regulator [Streptomyces sp. TRM64462]
MGLVERHEQLAQLDRLISAAAEQRGQVAVVESAGPNGKTELLDHAVARAEGRGFRVLRAVGARSERVLGMGVVRQLFHGAGVPGEAGELIDDVVALERDGSVTEPGARTVELYDRLSRVLLGLAGPGRPLVVAVDDVHHADAASLRCLLHLARRIGPVPVLLLCAGDTGVAGELPLFDGELQRLSYARRITVGPLGPDGVRDVLVRRLGAERAESVLPEMVRVSGGNALLLTALVEDYAVSGGVRPQGYGLAFVGHLERGDATALAVVRALAVLGREGTAAELGELAGGAAGDVSGALYALNASGLLDDGWFRTEVARLAVLGALPRTERDRLQVEAARLLHQRGAAVTRVAAHLVEAQTAPGPWAVDALREAAEHALLADRRTTAVACLELAHRFCDDEAGRTAVLARLAHAEWLGNPSSAVRHLGALAGAASAGRLGRTERLALVRRLLWHGRTEEAGRTLQRLRGAARVPQPGQSTELPDFEHWLAWTYPALAKENRPQAAVDGGPHPGLPGLPGLPGRSGPLLQATGLLADALTRGRPQAVAGQAERVLGDLLRSRADDWSEEAVLTALSVLTAAGRPADAVAWCDRLTARDVHRLPPALRAFVAAAKAEAALRLGDLATALEQARMALVLVPPKAWGTAVGLPLGSLVLAATRTGAFDEVARWLAQSVPEQMVDSRYGLTYLYARGHHQLATGHSHAALADFLACGERMRVWGLDVPGLPAWRAGAGEAWLRLGNADQARKLAYAQLGRPDSAGPYARALALRLMAASGPAKRRPQLLAEALELFEECGDQYEQARVLAELSQAHHAVGDSRRARMLFRRARHMAQLCGAAPLCEELLSGGEGAGDGDGGVGGGAAGSGGPASVAVPGEAGLTESERRVAALAVRGYTNREIAGKLYVTPSTVEQHLTRTYRKLGIKQRKELPAGLGAAVAA